MNTSKRRFFPAAACLVLLVLVAAGPGRAAERRHAAFGRASLSGTGGAVMEVEMVPARVARVAVRPGSKGSEVWALGISNARVPGWSRLAAGQVVFLKRTAATGWVVVGPPRRADGAVFNPVLSSIALAASGEGWGVGDNGVILRRLPGSDEWRETDQSGRLTTEALTSISLADKGETTGLAVGSGPVILRLESGRWRLDPGPADLSAQTDGLHAVADAGGGVGYAIATGQVSGVDSTSLLVYRRTPGGWQRLPIGQEIFDSPPARSRDGGLNRAAEAGAVAADATGAWIGGRIHPRGPSAPDGDDTPGDATRAFTLRFDAATGQFRSYCPDAYADRVGGIDLTRMCDEPFPTTPHHITSFSIVPGGDVFAGGLGLFRFSSGGWYREPNAAGYLISVAMGSNVEGWVASPGRSLGSGGMIRSSATWIGHWTRVPDPPSIARWPQPNSQLLESVASDGSGRAVAVGTRGAAVINRGTGWDSINPIYLAMMHATAWPPGGPAWAVGGRGRIIRLDGNEWKSVDSPVDGSLFAIAFSSATDGIAAGTDGVIVYRKGSWTKDRSVPSSVPDIYAAAAVPGGYVLAGKDGTVLIGRPGSWRVLGEARAAILRDGAPNAPSLYAAAAYQNGAIVGGQDGALLLVDREGRVRQFPHAVEGTVLAMAAHGDGIYASVSPDEDKYRGDVPVAQRGSLLRFADGRWTDVGRQRRVTLLRDVTDSASFDDPVYGISLDGPDVGWAVGGSPAEVKNIAEGHFRAVETSSVYRVDHGGDPSAPVSRGGLAETGSGVRFAVFAESWCGTGLCSSAVGTGTMSDEVALRIRDDINEASTKPEGPSFVLFAGGMRSEGIPEELEQFRNYLAGFRIPVFATPGVHDRYRGVGSIAGSSLSFGADTGSHDFWKQTFAAMPEPWGRGRGPVAFRPVLSSVAADPNLASTHWAFDYLQNGRAALRVVALDSSTRSFGSSEEQNPAEDQRAWFNDTILQARQVLGIPVIVLTNQPPTIPTDPQQSGWGPDRADFELTTTTNSVSAVITGGPRVNQRGTVGGVVPLFIAGGGGGPLGRDRGTGDDTASEPSKLPSDGYFHAWHLINVDPASPIPLGLGRVRVADRVQPVVESVAVHSIRGTELPAGQSTDISAVARGLSGGFSDPDQAYATYLRYGVGGLPRCNYPNEGKGFCISGSALLPSIRFRSLNPSVADFFKRNPLDPGTPHRLGDSLVPDPGGTEGLLCGLSPGRAPIEVSAGQLRTRLVITVGPGNGPCIEKEVPPPPPPPPPPTIQDFPQPVEQKEPPAITLHRVEPEVATVIPPPPAPVVAPAPPGAPGVGRKEEHEFQTESEGHGDHSFTAREIEPRGWPVTQAGTRDRVIADQAWILLGGISLFAFTGAAVAGALRRKRLPDIARVRDL